MDVIQDFNYAAGLPEATTSELVKRFDELSKLQQEQTEIGTSVPQLYGSLSRFIANPSTIGVETMKRMLDTDDTLGSGVDFMNMAMVARWGEYKHPSKEVTDFVQRALGQMEGSFHGNIEEMLSAEWAGFSVTEQVWKHEENFLGLPAFLPKRLVTYPPLTLVFAVDRQGNILPDGIYQYQRFYNSFFNTTFGYGMRTGDQDGFRPDLFAAQGDFPYPVRIAADLSYLTVKVPRDKVIHLVGSSTGKFNNPYGRSPLRRAYKNWVLKDAMLKMWIVAADRKGTPLIVGYAAPNDTVFRKGMNEQEQGAVKEERADLAMARTLSTIHNQSAIVLPGRKGETFDIEAVQIQGDMNVFKDGCDYFNRMMMRSLLLPPLVMGGDGGGSYSLGQEHHKLLEKIVDGKLKAHKQGVLDQFVRKIIAYNFPESAWKRDGCGEFKLEEYDVEMMEKLSNVFRSLTETGYMTPEHQTDMDEVRAKLNLSKKDAVEPLSMDAPSAPVGEELDAANGDGKAPEFNL